MTANRHKLYMIISSIGTLVMSVVNVSISVAFIVPFVWYAYTWKKNSKQNDKSYLIWLSIGVAGIIIALVRTILQNV